MVGKSITDADGVLELVRAVHNSLECAVDTETDGLLWALGNKAVLATFAPNEQQAFICSNADLVKGILDLLDQSGPLCTWVFHNAVFDLHMLRSWTGWMPAKGYKSLALEDTMHALRIQFPGQSAKLKDAVHRFWPDEDDLEPQRILKEWRNAHTYFKMVAGKRVKVEPAFSDVPPEILHPYALQDALITMRLHHYLKRLRAEWQRPAYLFDSIPSPDEAYRAEVKLIGSVLVDLERKGLFVRMPTLRRGLVQSSEMMLVQQKLWDDTGFTITTEKTNKKGEVKVETKPASITSHVQLNNLFYKQFGEPVRHRSKPTKTNKDGSPSTGEPALVDASTLNGKKLSSIVLPFRNWKKYNERLTEIDSFISIDGRVHTSLKNDAARTGRFSSTEPALQNLSRPDLLPSGLLNPDKAWTHSRAAFGPPPGFEWLIWDLSQIELRLAAHFMRDQEMIQAFIDGVDFHTLTASRMYGVPLEKVTKKMRAIAKILNFSILYGAGVNRITETLRYGAAGTEPLTLEDVAHALYELLPEEFKVVDGLYLHRVQVYSEHVDPSRQGLRYEWEEMNEDQTFRLLGQTLYAAYHRENPKVREFTDKASERAKKYGGIYTAFGLFIPIPKPTWSAEHGRFLTYFHKAGNAVVQGSAAGLMKALMVRDAELCEQYCEQNGLKMWDDVSLIMSIHDEAMHEVPVGHALPLARFMDGPLSVWPQFNVPIVLEYAHVPEGGNWAEKKGLKLAA